MSLPTLRTRRNIGPIIMLTALDREGGPDAVQGLESGADGYVTRIRLAELRRPRSRVLRRGRPADPTPATVLAVGR